MVRVQLAAEKPSESELLNTIAFFSGISNDVHTMLLLALRCHLHLPRRAPALTAIPAAKPGMAGAAPRGFVTSPFAATNDLIAHEREREEALYCCLLWER